MLTENSNASDTSAIDIIMSFYRSDDIVTLHVKPSLGCDDYTGQIISCNIGEYSDVSKELTLHNQHKRNIFLECNTNLTGAVPRIRAQHISLTKRQYVKCEKDTHFKLKPTMIICDGHLISCYWHVNSANLTLYNTIQNILSNCFDIIGSSQVPESTLIMLPGFYNNDNMPILVEAIQLHHERSYSQEALLECFG